MKNLFNYIKITFDLFLRCLLLFFFQIFQNLQIFLINETQQLFSISTNFSNFIENYIRNYNRWNGMEIWYFFFFYSSRAMRNEKIQRMLMMAYEWCHGSCISLRREKEREKEKKKKERRRKKKMPLSESNHFHADNFTAEWSPFSVNAPFHWTKQ